MRVLSSFVLLLLLIIVTIISSSINAVLDAPPAPTAPLEEGEEGAFPPQQQYNNNNNVQDEIQKFRQAEHTCIHDEIMSEQEKHHGGISQSKFAHPDGREAVSLGIGNMRIVVRTPDLFDSSQYCTAASGTVNDKRTSGGTIACSTTDDILTPAKRTLLIDKIIPAGLKMLTDALKVDQVSGNLVVSSTTACGSEWTIAAADTTTGVANADFVLYVAAAPITGNTLAFAGYCSLSSGRPVVGRMNFQAKHIIWNDNDPLGQEKAKRTVAHEVLHALGFSKNLILASPATVTRRGNAAIKEFQGTKTVAAVKEYYGCNTMTGAELETQSASSGTQLSHHSRRMMKDSVMAGIIGESRLDKITLSVMEDANIGYTADYSKGEFMVYGNNSYHGTGCGFSEKLAGETGAPLGDRCKNGDYPCHWCNDEGNTSMISIDMKFAGFCDYKANVGSTVTAVYRNFGTATAAGQNWDSTLLEGTAMVQPFSNRNCVDPTQTNSESLGHRFNANSRAVGTVGLTRSGSSTTRRATCLEFRCKSENKGSTWFLQFRIANDEAWANCNTDGTNGAVAAGGNYSGSIECPKKDIFCNNNYPEMFLYDFPTPVPGSGNNGGNNGGDDDGVIFKIGETEFKLLDVIGLAALALAIVGVILLICYFFFCRKEDERPEFKPGENAPDNAHQKDMNNNSNNEPAEGQYYEDDEGYQYYADGQGNTYWWDASEEKWHACA